eukprot:gnl/TRDRNA2_/TRDRNA2_176804_c1_seq2.p1 gnl/TRDRNA2_/TRDRNA2_176804_c1~~gnl/TRDRNA2_/TRDRNA2_176804_c1_seq2.p1  ORF type:complete len:600 (-),score=-40.24 gnl/TRDRNA2_/TRDRNA2_176804_c1_seq2:464-2263(-)
MSQYDSADYAEIIPLGAGKEVGRSCVVLRYRGKTIMFDCGLHPGRNGIDGLPNFNTDWFQPDISEVDIILITHFHNDHCAALPYVVAKTKFQGRILMTRPTKAIYYHVLKDLMQIAKRDGLETIFSKKDLENSMSRIEVINFHQTVYINKIKITTYLAGHVLGAAMFFVDIDGFRVLYTGDYSRETDRHMPNAEIIETSPHVVIIESTYGVSSHPTKLEREENFLQAVSECVLSKKGNVLLPVVAFGRAQEMMLLLENFWEKNSSIQHVPIYEINSIAAHTVSLYQSYIDAMNDEIKKMFKFRNPFRFKYIHAKDKQIRINELSSPCVVLATPSTMISGTSRDFFDEWCEQEQNTIIIVDYAVQGTLAREILTNPRTVFSRNGQELKLNISVEAISFSAHADFLQTVQFLDILRPCHVVLVHGEKKEMEKLAIELSTCASIIGIQRHIYMPAVNQNVVIFHRAERLTKVLGKLKAKASFEGRPLKGVLVKKPDLDFAIHHDDLETYASIRFQNIHHKQILPFKNKKKIPKIYFALETSFEKITTIFDKSKSIYEPISIIIGGIVSLSYVSVKNFRKSKKRSYYSNLDTSTDSSQRTLAT